MPAVSVLMSVYNGAPYLREAIDSILNQTLSDFEFIIVDDASTDETASILDTYTDPRIVRLTNPQNMGLTHSLNRGLAVVTGQYIARHDADDIALPERLAQQVAFMEAHPAIGMVGAYLIRLNPDGSRFETPPDASKLPALVSATMRWELLWTCIVAHTAVMLRKSVLDKYQLAYDPAFNGAEDYELWARMMHCTDLYKMSEIVVHVRILPGGVSISHRSKQKQLTYAIMKREVSQLLGTGFIESGLQTIYEARHFPKNEVYQDFYNAADLLLAAYHAHQKTVDDPIAQAQIRQAAMSWLILLANRAMPYSRWAAIYCLWCLRVFSWREMLLRMATHLYRMAKMRRSY